MITVFLPTRKGSERIKNKNTKKFAGIEGGLTKIKLNQLLKCKLIDKIILSTNDPEMINIGRKTSNIIEIDERDNYLCRSETKTDELKQTDLSEQQALSFADTAAVGAAAAASVAVFVFTTALAVVMTTAAADAAAAPAAAVSG